MRVGQSRGSRSDARTSRKLAVTASAEAAGARRGAAWRKMQARRAQTAGGGGAYSAACAKEGDGRSVCGAALHAGGAWGLDGWIVRTW